MNARRLRRVGRKRGAVLVETLVVMVPTCAFFLGVLQMTEICTENLVVQRAASAAARAAIVVLPDSDEYYDSGVNELSGERQQEIYKAADMILETNANYVKNRTSVAVTRAGAGENDPLTVTVNADFDCVVCPSGSVTLTASSTRIYQGAPYSYEFGTGSDFNPLPQP